MMTAVHRVRFVDAVGGHITAIAATGAALEEIPEKSSEHSEIGNSTNAQVEDLESKEDTGDTQTIGDVLVATSKGSNCARFAVGRSDGSILIYSPQMRVEMMIPGGHGRSIEGLCFAQDRLFSIGGSTVVTEWDLGRGIPLRNYDANAGLIWSIAVSKRQDRLAVGCDNGAVVIIDISDGGMDHHNILQRQEARVLSLCWKDSSFVIGGCSDGRIRIWDCTDGRGRLCSTMKVDKAKGESTLVWSILYLPRWNQIVSGDSTGSIKIWDFHHATLVQSFKIHGADVLCLSTDLKNMHIYSSGVNRKIFQISRTNNQWTVASNRLLHGNDVRAMTILHHRNTEFLISGGVEKTLVVNSLDSFADGPYRKVLPYGSSNIVVNKQQRLLVSWKGSVIKIWKFSADLNHETDDSYKLVCKLTLKDPQDIINCAMSPDGQVLTVSRTTTTKVFHLQETENRLKVTKLENNYLLKLGTRLVQFVDNSKIIIVTIDDELQLLDLESEDDDEKPTEFDLPDITRTKMMKRLPYLKNIACIDICYPQAVVARNSGSVDVLNLETGVSQKLVRLSIQISAIKINKARKSVLVSTVDNRLYELNLQSATDESSSIFTDWCKRNAENVPLAIKNQKESCRGIFIPANDSASKVWLWGIDWLARIDLDTDFPVSHRKKPRKHTRDGLAVEEDDMMHVNVDYENDELAGMDIDSWVPEIRMKSERSEISKGTGNHENTIFCTTKYGPLLFAGNISDSEIILVEKPQEKPQLKAYHLPKLVF